MSGSFPERADVVVVGAGFGGLGAAVSLAEAGRHVVVCEALTYPGGCASSFEKNGHRYESGATLFTGFGEGQLIRRWIERHRLAVRVAPLPDPVITLRAPGLHLPIPPDREMFIDRLVALPDAPEAAIRSFFALQRRVADALWELLDDPSLLPPWNARSLARHAARLPRYLPLVRLVGRPLGKVLAAHGLDGFEPLRIVLDAICQITIQTDAATAEAPFAMSALDYVFRGAAHVHGGIGELARALSDGVEGLGGTVSFANRVRGLSRDGDGWKVDTRKGTVRAQHVVANMLPADLARLAGADSRSLRRLDASVRSGWGAATLYRLVRADALPPGPMHVQCVNDAGRPLVEGNHLLASMGAASEARDGLRSVTISTHVDAARAAAEGADYIDGVHEALRRTLAARALDLDAATEAEISGSPRTFARFTLRSGGWVGGVPRRAGVGHYFGLAQGAVMPGLHLVGDTVFPGQSTLAAAVGGVRVAARIAGKPGLGGRLP